MYLDKLDEAKNFFEKSLSIKPNDESTNYNNGNLLRRCKEYDQASVFYKKSGKIGIPSYMENPAYIINTLIYNKYPHTY